MNKDKMTASKYVGIANDYATPRQKRIYGVLKQWNQTCADYADMGTNVLKLLAHPDTQLDQALKAWDMYRDASKRIHLMRSDLETRYPDYDFKI
jgi:hypothetical protein